MTAAIKLFFILLIVAPVMALFVTLFEMERRSKNWQVVYPDGARSKAINFYRAQTLQSLRGGEIIKLI